MPIVEDFDELSQELILTIINCGGEINRIFYIKLQEFRFMGERCQNCDKEMDNTELTHCSDECLFDTIKDSVSLEGDNAMSTIDDWDANPWV